MGLGFRFEGMEVEEDALNIKFRGLNIEETLKDHRFGLHQMSHRGLPFATSRKTLIRNPCI